MRKNVERGKDPRINRCCAFRRNEIMQTFYLPSIILLTSSDILATFKGTEKVFPSLETWTVRQRQDMVWGKQGFLSDSKIFCPSFLWSQKESPVPLKIEQKRCTYKGHSSIIDVHGCSKWEKWYVSRVWSSMLLSFLYATGFGSAVKSGFRCWSVTRHLDSLSKLI